MIYCLYLVFIKKNKTLRHGLSPLHAITCDQGFQKRMWISIGYGLRTINHDREKSKVIFSHGPWSRV